MTETLGAKRFLTGRWLLPMNGDPIAGGAIEIEGQRIKRVLNKEEFAQVADKLGPDHVQDYGEAVIMPGLINLHTHIEYSSLHLLDTNAALFDWIPLLMRHVKTWQPEKFVESATHGALQMARAGTTCILDSSYDGTAAAGAARVGLRAVIALELFGVVENDTETFWQGWLDRKEKLVQRFELGQQPGFTQAAEAISKGSIRLSVAPHAPYTVGPSLTRRAMEWADKAGIVWTMHVAESPEEHRWIASTSPRLDQFLQGVHTLPDGRVENIHWRDCGKSPVQHLADNDLLQSSLVAAHVVQVNESDIQELASRKVTVAHCPRSNSRLRCGMAPIGNMLTAGVSVGFGTDSAASTDDLDVLAEARCAWHLQRAVNPDFRFDSYDAIYRLTAGAAKAIGLSSDIGTLEPGKFADVAIFNISSASEVARERPYDLLLYGNVPLSDLWVAGEQVLKNALY